MALYKKGDEVTLFMGGLSPDTSEKDLERWANDYCSDFKVTLAKSDLSVNAFLVVYSAEVADRILGSSNVIKGRKVDCQLAIDKSLKAEFALDQRKRRVFINGLPYNVNERELGKAIAVFGEVRNLYTVKSKKKDRSLGYIEFTHRSQAKKAIKYGVIYGKKKYQVYSYRTLDEVQTKNKVKILTDTDRKSFAASSPRIGTKTHSANNIRKTDLQEGIDLGVDVSSFTAVDVNSVFHRNTKPVWHAYFLHPSLRLVPSSGNLSFAIRSPPVGHLRCYFKEKIKGSVVWLKRTKSCQPFASLDHVVSAQNQIEPSFAQHT